MHEAVHIAISVYGYTQCSLHLRTQEIALSIATIIGSQDHKNGKGQYNIGAEKENVDCSTSTF